VININIKAFLRTILTDPEIINLTGDKKVHFLHAISPVAPYVEYEIFDEDGALWAEGEEISTNYYVQVDIFSKGDYSILENKIKEKMLSADFERDMAADLYEPAPIDLYHKAMRFNYTEGG
jgi:hypothetical protein